MTLRSAQIYCQANGKIKYGISRLLQGRVCPFHERVEIGCDVQNKNHCGGFVLSLTGQRASDAARRTKEDIHGIRSLYILFAIWQS